MQFNIENRYTIDPHKAVFQFLIDNLNNEESQGDERWENALGWIIHFVKEHNEGINFEMPNANKQLIPYYHTELERLAIIHELAFAIWNIGAMGWEQFRTRVVKPMYNGNPKAWEKVEPIIELFLLWGWG